MYFNGPPNSAPIEGTIRRIPNIAKDTTAMQQKTVTVNPSLKGISNVIQHIAVIAHDCLTYDSDLTSKTVPFTEW